MRDTEFRGVGGTKLNRKDKKEGLNGPVNHSEPWMERGSRLARGTCTLRKMTQMESRRANPEYLTGELVVVREMERVHMAPLEERSSPFFSRSSALVQRASWWESSSTAMGSLTSTEQLEWDVLLHFHY